MGITVSLSGFILVMIAGLLMKDIVDQEFDNSPQLVHYYYWLFPLDLADSFFSS
jgi:hypothetical protein